MVDLVIYFLAFFITLPPAIMILIYIIGLKRHQSSMRAIHMTANWTTIFFVIAVDLIISMMFDIDVTGLLIAFMLFLLGVIIFFQWKNTEIHFPKAMRLLWRIAFLLFFFLYLLLILVGVIKRIFL